MALSTGVVDKSVDSSICTREFTGVLRDLCQFGEKVSKNTFMNEINPLGQKNREPQRLGRRGS